MWDFLSSLEKLEVDTVSHLLTIDWSEADDEEPVPGEIALVFHKIHEISPDVAIALRGFRSMPQVRLWFVSLKSLSDETARELLPIANQIYFTWNTHEVDGWLYFLGNELTLPVARLLAANASAYTREELIWQFPPEVRISDAALELLGQISGPCVEEFYLPSLKELSDFAADALSRSSIKSFGFTSIQELTIGAAKCFSAHGKGVYIGDDVVISDAAAQVLAVSTGRIRFRTEDPSPALVRLLQVRTGPLAIAGLTKLTPDAARCLALSSASQLDLHPTGLIPDAAAVELAARIGHLDISRITELDNGVGSRALAIRIVREVKDGRLYLSSLRTTSNSCLEMFVAVAPNALSLGLHELDEEVCRILSKHPGYLFLHKVSSLSVSCAELLAGKCSGNISLSGVLPTCELLNAIAAVNSVEFKRYESFTLSMKGAKDLTILRHVWWVRSIIIRDCPDFCSLAAGAGSWLNVQVLHIRNCPSLTSLSGVEKFKALRELRIENCPNLEPTETVSVLSLLSNVTLVCPPSITPTYRRWMHDSGVIECCSCGATAFTGEFEGTWCGYGPDLVELGTSVPAIHGALSDSLQQLLQTPCPNYVDDEGHYFFRENSPVGDERKNTSLKVTASCTSCYSELTLDQIGVDVDCDDWLDALTLSVKRVYLSKRDNVLRDYRTAVVFIKPPKGSYGTDRFPQRVMRYARILGDGGRSLWNCEPVQEHEARVRIVGATKRKRNLKILVETNACPSCGVGGLHLSTGGAVVADDYGGYYGKLNFEAANLWQLRKHVDDNREYWTKDKSSRWHRELSTTRLYCDKGCFQARVENPKELPAFLLAILVALEATRPKPDSRMVAKWLKAYAGDDLGAQELLVNKASAELQDFTILDDGRNTDSTWPTEKIDACLAAAREILRSALCLGLVEDILAIDFGLMDAGTVSRPSPSARDLSGRVFLFLGRLKGYSPQERKILLKRAGAVEANGLTSDVTDVVIGARPPAKLLQAARDRGLQLHDQAAFENLIGEA